MKTGALLLIPFVFILAFSPLAHADDFESRLKALEDTLKDQQKIIQEQQGVINELKGELSAIKNTPAPAAVAAAPAAPKAEAKAERPLDGTLTSLEQGIARLGGDTVKMKIGLCFQAGWVNDDSGKSVALPPTNDISYTSGNQFFVRRARLFFTGDITDKLGFKVSIEPALDVSKFSSSTVSGGNSILRDAYVWADYIPYTRVTVGQFKVPYGIEGMESIADNPTVNRSFATNLIYYPTLRDMGIMASGKFKTAVSDMPLGMTYAVAVVNGRGYNLADDNNTKDVSARITVNPFVQGLNIGGSWYTGRTHHLIGTTSLDKKRNRWAAEADYLPSYVKGLRLRGEFLWDNKFYDKAYAWANFPNSSNLTLTTAGTAHSYGWYLLAAYRVDGLPGVLGYLNGFEPLVRYDMLDEQTGVPDTTRTRTTIGLNYYVNKYTRLMANYEIIHADGSLMTSSLDPVDLVGHHVFTTQLQLKF